MCVSERVYLWVFNNNNFRKLHMPWAVFILSVTCLLVELLECSCHKTIHCDGVIAGTA